MSRLRHPNIVLIMGISMRNVGAMNGGGGGGSNGGGRTESVNSSSTDYDTRSSVVENLYIISEFMDKGSLSDIMMLVRQEER